MGLLGGVDGPDDLRSLSGPQLAALSQEIRAYLVDSVSRTGGHLGPNLGVVELTIALHRTFSSPTDRIVFDTGHQAYVHKLLTGRRDFSTLRQKDGLSGYPSRAESEHDIVENSHASTAISWADGLARANQVQGLDDRVVVAVIGDGALTGGMAWEALNNIAADETRRVVIVVNDNGRSYAPTIGGVANHLHVLRTTQGYEKFLAVGKRTLRRGGQLGEFTYNALHGLKKGIRDVVMPQGLFEDLGIKYIGPIDGHDIEALEHSLTLAKNYGGPVIVHAITEKGRGYVPAETDVSDRFHAVGIIHPETGLPVSPSKFGWTSVFAEEMVAIGAERRDIVAITAAMLAPVGLAPFAEAFPSRVFDVGIAEQHAATAAAGMAAGGLHPVVALYATFLNRAFDQVLMDVALHKAGVTFVLDRAGLTGDDGASHNGMWDMAIMRVVPGLRLAAPRDGVRLRQALREAVAVDDAPTVVRYPKGPLGEEIPAVDVVDGVDVLARVGKPSEGEALRDVLLIGIGPMASLAVDVAARLGDQGLTVTVADPRWVFPMADGLVHLAESHRAVVTIEDGLVEGGFGDAYAHRLRDAGVDVQLLTRGIPDDFLPHATRSQLEEMLELRPSDVARDVLAMVLAGEEMSVPLEG